MIGMPGFAKVVTIAFLVTVALVLVLHPVSHAIGLVDKPGGRKSHTGDIPIVGGIAMYFGALFAAVIEPVLSFNAVVMLSVAALLVFVGVIDDRFDLRPAYRLLAHLAAGAVLVLGTGYEVSSVGDLFGVGELKLGPAATPVTVVACITLVNACNMLDGMDGLAGGTAFIAFVAFAAVAVTSSADGPALVCLAMLGGIIGFLPFNLPANFNRRMRTFMGDAGSTLLGFTLASVALVLIQPANSSLPPAYVLWFVPIPIFEIFTSVVRRVRLGMSPMVADTGHFHHRLLAAGFSVRLIFAIYCVLSAACAGMGLVAYYTSTPEWVLFAGFIAMYAAWLLFVRHSDTLGTRLPTVFRRDLENLHI